MGFADVTVIDDGAADEGHGELADEGDDDVDEIIAARQSVVQRRTQSGCNAALHRAQQHAAQQADRVGKVHLRAQQRKPEQRDHIHHRSHHRGKAQIDGVHLVLPHLIHPPEKRYLT